MGTLFWLLIAGFALVSHAHAQGRGGASGPDPYTLANVPAINSNTNGRTAVSSVPASPTTTAIVITPGQSLMVSEAEGTYATTQAGSRNINIYDGGTYPCANPVLGTQKVPTYTNSPNCIIADGLISGGTYTDVRMVPIAVGATVCADWAPGGVWNHRIVVTMNRLKALNLTPLTGFTGDLWILIHNGENDNTAGTPRATLAACYRAVAQSFVDNGSGTARFFVPTESISANTASSTVTGAQADAVASGCSTCRQGANYDSLTGGTNRQTDGTHLTQVGNAAAAALDVAIIANCKATAC